MNAAGVPMPRSVSFSSSATTLDPPVPSDLVRGKTVGERLDAFGRPGAEVEAATPQRKPSTTEMLSLLGGPLSRKTSSSKCLSALQQSSPQDDCFFDFDDLPPVVRGFSQIKLAPSSSSIEGLARGDEGEEAGYSDPIASLLVTPDPNVGTRFLRQSSAPPAPRKDGMRVALLVSGSTGDLYPLIAMAKCLSQQHHHNVRMFTNANTLSECLDRGIEAVSVFADVEAVLRLHPFDGGIVETLHTGALGCQAWLKANPTSCEPVEDALAEFRPDALLCCAGASGAGMRYEYDTGVPAMAVWLHSISVEYLQAALDAEPPRPQFLAISPLLNTVPGTKPPCLHQTGPWVLNDIEETQQLEDGGPLESLQRFLKDGPPPVVIGWGSMIDKGTPPQRMVELSVSVLSRARRRGVVLGGWAKLHEVGRELVLAGDSGALGELAEFASTQICFVASAPHGWLFPQCLCVIHHGGAGTTQAAIRAGIPSVVTPIFADQFETAKVLKRIGAGVGFEVGLRHVSEEQLLVAMTEAIKNRDAIKDIARRMQAERGLEQAGVVLDTFLRREVKTGVWASKVAQFRNKQGR